MQTTESLKKYVRASNYLSVAQIYLQDNILLKRPLECKDIKPRLLGHWGTCPGINFVYAHINNMIIKNNAPYIYIIGTGHGFPGLQANLFIEKSLSKYSPKTLPYNEKGLTYMCSNFSAPYGFPSHSNPEAPGVILEGGELGYSLSIAYGSVLDNPELISCVLIGDGEAETGPLAGSWQINKLISPLSDGAVLPILHVNEYKISGPTFFGRMSDTEIHSYFTGLGYECFIVDVYKNTDIYEEMEKTMDRCYSKIRSIQKQARNGVEIIKPQWPMIVLKTPKGWTGVKEYKHTKLEGNCLSHQVILGDVHTDKKQLQALEQWLKSYKFNELIQEINKDTLSFIPEIQNLIPQDMKSCGTQKLAFGGNVMKKLKTPNLSNPDFLGQNTKRGENASSSMATAGKYLKEIFILNKDNNNFRVFSPDETYSNKISDVFEVTKRSWQWPLKDFDTDFGREGKVMEMLSEHSLFGLMHGFTVTGRHGVFVSYEAFAQVISSMVDQYAKFIKISKRVAWRKPVPSLNIILTSLLERQDHNGFSHQNPSFIANMTEKDGEFINVYFPPDSYSMAATLTQSFQSTNSINVVVAGKKPLPLWLSKKEADQQVKDGIMTWDFASDLNPDIILVGTGDYITQECLAAITLLKSFDANIRIRFVSVSTITATGIGSCPIKEYNKTLDHYFTNNKPVIYNFHGYPQTIKKILFDYKGSQRVEVHGYIEEGSTTTPFDMQSRNTQSRYHMVTSMAKALYEDQSINEHLYENILTHIDNKIQKHKEYILKHGIDPEEIDNWTWNESE